MKGVGIMIRVNLCEDIEGRGLKSRIITTDDIVAVNKIVGIYAEKVGSPYCRYCMFEDELKVMIDYGSHSTFIEVAFDDPVRFKNYITN